MSSEPGSKSEALLELARLRQSIRREGYDCIGDFHCGAYECDHVSPYTKSGNNTDAEIMIVAQDWASSDALSADPLDRVSAELGYDPKIPTNRKLDALLTRHFGLSRADCYLTNLFPFVKHGGMSAHIPRKDLVYCAQTFTLPEIGIVDPRLVICLGLNTFLALRSAAGHSGSLKIPEAVRTPFCIGETCVHCVAHTGARGTNNRGREQVERDWQHLARIHRSRLVRQV
ncbi:MAG: hypothetical protein OXH59_06840 [Rhodospirillaceae bacterium]|nr:hypothetical protein [Rhodospirillaceae bacterium]